MNMDMVMKKEINDSVKTALAKKIDAAIKSPEVKKYADSNELAEAAMQPLLNKDGMIDLKLKVGGTTRKTNVQLVQPQLDSLSTVVQKAAGSVATQAGKQLLEGGQKKALENIQDLFKKK